MTLGSTTATGRRQAAMDRLAFAEDESVADLVASLSEDQLGEIVDLVLQVLEEEA